MKSRTLLIFALSSLLLTAFNEGDPLPGGYAIFIPAAAESMMLASSNNEGVAGAALAQIGNSGTLLFGEI